MPYGVLADIFCIILGGIIGPNLNIKITYKYREPLIKIFGISALAIGIVSFIDILPMPKGRGVCQYTSIYHHGRSFLLFAIFNGIYL